MEDIYSIKANPNVNSYNIPPTYNSTPAYSNTIPYNSVREDIPDPNANSYNISPVYNKTQAYSNTLPYNSNRESSFPTPDFRQHHLKTEEGDPSRRYNPTRNSYNVESTLKSQEFVVNNRGRASTPTTQIRQYGPYDAQNVFPCTNINQATPHATIHSNSNTIKKPTSSNNVAYLDGRTYPVKQTRESYP